MPRQSFHQCARRFARTWARGERPIFEGLASTDRATQLKALQDGAAYFRIARNFHRRYDVRLGAARLEPVLQVLAPYRSMRLDLGAMRATVAELRLSLGQSYGGGDKLSAATKLLWLLHRAPAIIYDSQARRALGAPVGDYDRYVSLWRRGYRENRSKIRDVCQALPQPTAEAVPFPSGKAPEWFSQRVYDIYLWSAGSK